jgi:hypothetical protein
VKSSISPVARAALLAAFSVALQAQWPDYPTPNVPKLPDGKVNMEGPVPRTADGHPDFSGIWQFNGARGFGGLVIPPSPPPSAAPPPTGGPGTGPGARPPGPNQFFNIGSTLKDGLPFTPWAEELRKKRKAENNKDNPDAHCLPLGLMQLHTHPQPRKIIQTPAVIVIIYEANSGLRQVFMDGRPLPNNEPQPWWYGYSIGKWDGDTLVVETTGFRDDVWLDVEGSPLTNTGKMTERFRRLSYGNLEIDITVEDPKAYTKPWTVTVKQHAMLNTDLIEFVCQENERSASHLVGN